jgi:hypothetical protein
LPGMDAALPGDAAGACYFVPSHSSAAAAV